jgi:hypothetical protein
LVSWCLGVLVSWCLGVLVSWCLGVLVSWCLGGKPERKMKVLLYGFQLWFQNYNNYYNKHITMRQQSSEDAVTCFHKWCTFMGREEQRGNREGHVREREGREGIERNIHFIFFLFFLSFH